MTTITTAQARKHFTDWEFTPMGSFRNKVTNRVLNRKDWEIEMAYECADDPEALAAASVLAEHAARMATV